MVTHKNVLVDELPLKYDAGNHLGVITHKIAAFVSPIEHMFVGFIVIQSVPSFSETTYTKKPWGRMLHSCESRPTKLLRQGIKGMNPPSRVTFNFMAKKLLENLGATHQDAEKSSTSCPTSNLFCLSRLRRPTLGWKPASFFVGIGWPSHFDIRVMCWNETIQSWSNQEYSLEIMP